MACDVDGNVYVAEQSYRIQVFNSNGDYLRQWGDTGTGQEHLDSPWCVAIGPDGLAYVGDFEDQSVKVFTTTGTFVRSWGDATTLPRPSGIAVDDSGYVYLAGAEVTGWGKFTSAGQEIGWFGSSPGPGLVHGPIGIATDGTNCVYVEGGGFLKRFTTNGEFVSSVAVGNVSYLACDDVGNVYLTLSELGRAEKRSPDGKLLASWGAPRNDSECGFNDPGGIAVDHAGNIYLADGMGLSGNPIIPACIQKFAFVPSPVQRRTWGQIKAIYR